MTKNILDRFGQKKQTDIQQALADNRINASGRLSNSIQYEIKEKGFVFSLTISADGYFFAAVQEGRGPTEEEGPGELRVRIDQWVDIKPVGIPPELTKSQFVNATTNKIHKVGTEKWIKYGSKGKTTGILEEIFTDKDIDRLQKELVDQAELEIVSRITRFKFNE